MAEYITACLRAAGTNFAVSGAIGSTLTPTDERASKAAPHRLLSMAASTIVVDGDVRFGLKPALTRAVYAAAAGAVGSISQTPCMPPAIIPVATVEHDNTQLMYGAHGTCVAQTACVGAGLDGSPGALNSYVLPCGNTAVSGYCLLCIRCDAAALNAVYNEVARQRPKTNNPAIVVPPFQNLVNCPNGYKAACCGVTPNSALFSPVHVVGCNFAMRVVQRGNTLCVDQDEAVWLPNPSFLGCGPSPLMSSGSACGPRLEAECSRENKGGGHLSRLEEPPKTVRWR